MCLVVALSFIKLCDPSEMSFIHVRSRSRALHQLNFYIGSQLCHSIHPQNKTPCLMISLSLSNISQMRHGLSKKKMACPRCMTQKNGHINVHEKKRRREREEKEYIQPCPHIIQIKEREIHKMSILFSPSTFHICALS